MTEQPSKDAEKGWWRDVRCKVLHWLGMPGSVQPGDYGEIEVQVTEVFTKILIKDEGLTYFFNRENGLFDGLARDIPATTY